jgi:4-hydroxy-3-methylbut-2-enyl diphosphate reductase
MKIYNVNPRGYCIGVVSAINIAKDTRKKYPNEKISILGMLVHNEFVNNELTELGIETVQGEGMSRLELLEKIDEGIVIMTAHGVGDIVIAKAKAKGLHVVDATCHYVSVTHNVIKEKLKEGKKILFLGKSGHPESEGTLSIDDSIILITKIQQLNDYIGPEYFITNQTTLSYDFVIKAYEIANANGNEVANEICDATRTRQAGIKEIPSDVDVVFIVGDVKSNNSNKLLDLAKERFEAYLIPSKNGIDDSMIRNKSYAAISSGASTPTWLTNEVVDYLEKK